MFVPNLSWQMIAFIYKWLKHTLFVQDEGDATRDKYRAKALKLAALKLKGHPTLVTTEQQVPAIY
eukprot:COSAG06_NODE_4_length_41837_cov_204.557597_18_plen_65_part_00